MKTLETVLATANAHKVLEFNQIVEQHAFPFVFMPHPAPPADVEETGSTLEENAQIKARAYFANLDGQTPVLSDDSGLFVRALKGEPGVYSARYGGDISQAAKNQKIVSTLLEGGLEYDRYAEFRCCLCLKLGEDAEIFGYGVMRGAILCEPNPGDGFGYDPIFVPEGYEIPVSALGPEVKHGLSHRFRALADLVSNLTKTVS